MADQVSNQFGQANYHSEVKVKAVMLDWVMNSATDEIVP